MIAWYRRVPRTGILGAAKPKEPVDKNLFLCLLCRAPLPIVLLIYILSPNSNEKKQDKKAYYASKNSKYSFYKTHCTASSSYFI